MEGAETTKHESQDKELSLAGKRAHAEDSKIQESNERCDNKVFSWSNSCIRLRDCLR